MERTRSPRLDRAALAVQAKSLMGWVAGYQVPLSRGLIFDGPGSTTLKFKRLPFTGERRHLYPIAESVSNPLNLWQSI